MVSSNADNTALEIDAQATTSRAFVYDDAAVLSAVTAFDTSITANKDAIVELEIATIAAETIVYNFVDNANIGVVSISDQQIVYVYDDVEFINLDAIFDTSTTLNSTNAAELTASISGPHSQLYATPAETLALELDSYAKVNKTFSYDDTAQFIAFGATDSEFIYNFETVVIGSFAATDDIDVVYNFSSLPALEVVDNSTQSSTRQFVDQVDFVQFGASSIELLVNIENEAILVFGVTDDIDIVYNFIPQAYITAAAQDTITKSVSSRTNAMVEVAGITNQFYYTKFKQIYANDTIKITLQVDSDEMKISGVAGTAGPKQIWIG